DTAVVVAQAAWVGAEGDGEALELLELRREEVAGRAVDEEPPVPRPLAERVRLAEDVVVGVVEHAGVAHRGECGNGARGAHAVFELEELRAELDIGEAAPAELEVVLRVLVGGDALVFDACLDATDLAPICFRER